MSSLRETIYKKPTAFLILAYVSVILVGTGLLMLPISSQTRVVTPMIDAWFTSTSAFCVTGLVPLTTATYWSTFGQVVILILIQLGGLGIMSLATIIAVVAHRRIDMQSRRLIREETGSDSTKGVVKLILYIVRMTFLIEGIGALLLSFQFVPQFGWGKGLWYAVFHAISAFCNAGFDILGTESLVPYSGNALVMLTICMMIVFGGLGYRVIQDVVTTKNFDRLRTHSKIVISTTIVLLIIGILFFLATEWSNPNTLAGMPFHQKLLNAIFQSVTPRTAGYFSMNQSHLTNASVLFTIILMFIGGSPASTAGGIKTTTFITLIGFINSEVRGRGNVIVFRRSLSKTTALRAGSVMVASLLWCTLGILLLSILEPDVSTLDLSYEMVSAFATVGLSRNLTPVLSAASKFILSLSMIGGKIGILGLVFAISKPAKAVNYQEAETSIIIG